MSLPPPIVPLTESALIDEAAQILGCDLGELMARAGAALAREAQHLVPEGPVLVACGPGNNGGDGYVCARILRESGRQVTVWPVVAPVSPLCLRAAEALTGTIPPSAPPFLPRPALVIDAVLGAGTRGRPREPIASALGVLRELAAAGVPVLAGDVPSGLGSDLEVPAVLSVCFQTAKAELLRSGGEFTTVDLGIPSTAWQEIQPVCLRRFPPLRREGRKGTHGELLIIGGGLFPGALEFAARAAVRTGCDLVRAWTAGTAALPPTVVSHRQDRPSLVPGDPEELTPLIVRAGAVLIGPGLGQEEGTYEAARQAFSLALELGVPVVLDADGITACAAQVRAQDDPEARVLLTPHAREARTLLGSAATEASVHAFARRNRVILAKGPVDLVTDGWRWQHNHRGNPRMTVGGTGDVLAGLAAGLLARGALPYDAARMAVLWITTAGDSLWPERGPCYDTLDLIEALPPTLRRLMEPLGYWPPVV